MSTFFKAGMIGSAALFTCIAGPAEAAQKCVRAGGSANMITRDLAVFMAKAALGNAIKGMGAKPVGWVKVTCKDGLPVYCLARQKACK